MLWGRALAPAGRGGCDSVEARARPSLVSEPVDGLVQVAARVFEGGCGAAPPGDQAPEHLGKRVARPGIGHRYPDAAGGLERRGAWRERRGMGSAGQNGYNLARAPA